MLVKEIKSGNKTVQIFHDEYAINPREDWDNLGTMVCFHGRYELGDKKHGFRQGDYNSFAELKRAMEKEGYVAILPIYLYDHSGITLSTNPFNCRWDSGQVGFIGVTKEKIRKEYQVKRVTKEIIEKVTTVLEGEVEIQDDYVTGRVYGFKSFEDGKEVDSCWGFFGDDFEQSGLLGHADIEE